jgi:hypothetical protein
MVLAYRGGIDPNVSSRPTGKDTREEDGPPVGGRSESDRNVLQEIAGALPAALAVGAALVYGLLILAYSEFYSELGVRPSEVGLQYGPGIGGIAGVAIIVVLVVVASLLVFFAARSVYRNRVPKELRRARSPVLVLTICLVVSLFCIGVAMLFTRAANTRADQVKQGLPVEPVRIFGLEFLSVRADLANVKATNLNAAPTPVLKKLRGREKLLYLGRTSSTLVLYDANAQSSWHVPASAVAVRVANCETRRATDPDCPD